MEASMSVYVRLSIIFALCWQAAQAATTNSCSKIGSKIKYFDLEVSAGYAAPDGFARPIYLVNGQSPGPLIDALQGETFSVNVTNNLPVQIGMHWHGLHQQGTPQYDGVPGLNQYAIPPGASMIYCFGTESNYGAYWYHVHLRDIYQDGVRGPILIQPNNSIARPYDKISNVQDDVSGMHRAEQLAAMVMVNDWFHETSEEISLRLAATNDSMQPLCASSVLFNGMGRVQCPPPLRDSNSYGCSQMSVMNDMGDMEIVGSSMSMPAPTSTARTVSTLAYVTSPGATKSATASMSMPAVTVSDSVAESCRNTSTPRYVLPLSSNGTWHMIHLVNAGASQQLAFSIDEHDLWVVSADGAFVLPQRVQVVDIGIGQRYGIMWRKPDSPRSDYTIRASTRTHQAYQGSAILRYTYSGNADVDMSDSESLPWIGLDGSPLGLTAQKLNESALQPFPPDEVPKATKEIRLMVNQSEPTVWVLQTGHPFRSNNGQETPLLFAPRNVSGVFWLNDGDVVDVLLQVVQDSLDTMAHPIHLHGHSFRVLGSAANSTFPTNLTASDVAASAVGDHVGIKINSDATAPRRDTAHLPEAGWLALRFAAGNPGVWLLHCHINSHLASGMAVAFVELPDKFPSFGEDVRSPPTIAPLHPIPPLA